MSGSLYLTTRKFHLFVGHIESGETDEINFNHIMVSFSEFQESEKNLILICLGVFIRSNWILVTINGGNQLNLSKDIVIKSGDQAIQTTLSQNMKIDDIKSLHPDSRFKIVYVSKSEIQLYNLDFN